MKNDRKIIYEDINYIYKNVYLFEKKIDIILFPTIEDNFIGNHDIRVKHDNYVESFINMSENSLYSIRMFDGSLINYKYYFNNVEELISFSISFIPNIESETLFKNFSIENILAKYIRIDWEEDGYVPFVHPLVHFHNNINRDSIRIAIENEVYPSEFLYIILKHIYNIDLESLKLYLESKKNNKRCAIRQEEREHFILKVY